MAYVTDEMIREMEERYGKPRRLSMAYEIHVSEMDMVRGSRKHDRNHDITMFIFRDRSYREFAGIAKHMFPPGVFRAPSGAANPGESLEAGARREALEETGLEIELDRFILFINVRFTSGPEAVDWRSMVFTALRKGGDLAHRDLEEIREVAWVTLDELQGPIRRRLLDTGMGLFAYRVALHDAAVEEIEALRRPPEPDSLSPA
jgi:ADP-ribose pyrophosphatase YjhB (NUDIX family)